MPTLRFTGSRTGLTGIWLPKYGAVERGGEIDVPDDVAQRWLSPPSDFELVEGQAVESFWDVEPEPEPEEPVAVAAVEKSEMPKVSHSAKRRRNSREEGVA